MESLGRLGKSAMQLLNVLAEPRRLLGRWARRGRSNALRKLCVALCRGIALMFRKSHDAFARVSGHAFWEGIAASTFECA
jgi:hypothetical protein